MKLIVVALLVAVVSASVQSDMRQFMNFVNRFGKSYDDLEFGHRFQVFQDNLKLANGLQAAETGSATYGMTKFMDLTTDEFRALYLMPKDLYANFQVDSNKVMAPLAPVALPDSYDWRDKKAVTNVYDQGQCGSCWAFSATETIESYNFLAGHTLTSLSPQQIVDCDTDCYGCNGGWTQNAFNYVINAGGQDTLASYPYDAQDGNCAFKPANIGAKLSSWSFVTQSDDENAMQQAVYQKGPLSICVDASSWQFYNGGVIQSCGQQVDHCVMITGYATISGIPAWTVRNSWGTSWGLSGYLYVARGANVCAIGSCVITLVEK